jgi:hypothetical protein
MEFRHLKSETCLNVSEDPLAVFQPSGHSGQFVSPQVSKEEEIEPFLKTRRKAFLSERSI